MANIYSEKILRHQKDPTHFGKLEQFTIRHKGYNAFHCGDMVEYYIELDEEKDRIIAVSFQNEGCALSKGSASILAEHAIKTPVDKLLQMKKDDLFLLCDLTDLPEVRVGCVMVSLETLQKALKKATNKNKGVLSFLKK